MSDENNDSKKFDVESYWTAIKGKWQKSEMPAVVAAAKVSRKGANFKSDLAKGQNAEHDFYVKYASCVVRTDGRRGDMELLKTGEIIELKSDFYDPAATENFFFERYSYDEKNGGIWQAADHNVTYFVYWFPLDGSTYIFNVQQLLRKLNKLTKNMELVPVRNQGYVTRGYKVPRAALAHLFLDAESVGLYAK